MLSDVRYQPEGLHFLRRMMQGQLLSPLLLVGDEGVGRKFSVLQAAKEMFCQNEDGRDGCRCYGCQRINQGTHPDLTVIAPEQDKDIGVDIIRRSTAEAYSYPSVAPVKMFVIDGVDRMTLAASNALLKTLEEPPSTVRFCLLTESYNGVIDTIRSRCGRVSYNRLPLDFVVSILQRFESDPAKALVYGRMGEGSAGRAVGFWGANRLKLRDRVLQLLEHGIRRDLPAAFSIVDELGSDLSLALRFLEQVLHDLLLPSSYPSGIINVDVMDWLKSMQSKAKQDLWGRMWSSLRDLQDLRQSTHINTPFHIKSLLLETFFG